MKGIDGLTQFYTLTSSHHLRFHLYSGAFVHLMHDTKIHASTAHTFWLQGFSLISLLTFNEAYSDSFNLIIVMYLP